MHTAKNVSTATVVAIYRVTDGKISEEWVAEDVAAIMTQTIMAKVGAVNRP